MRGESNEDDGRQEQNSGSTLAYAIGCARHYGRHPRSHCITGSVVFEDFVVEYAESIGNAVSDHVNHETGEDDDPTPAPVRTLGLTAAVHLDAGHRSDLSRGSNRFKNTFNTNVDENH